MRINKYKTKLDNDGLAFLIKESATNYIGDPLSCPSSIVKMLNDTFDLQNETEEYVYLLCFNTKFKLIGVFELSHGCINSSLVSTRELFQKALLCNAATIIIAHNHPSGDTTPSQQDITLAKKVSEAGLLMDIPLSDNIIIGSDYYSFKENTIL